MCFVIVQGRPIAHVPVRSSVFSVVACAPQFLTLFSLAAFCAQCWQDNHALHACEHNSIMDASP
eukprot:7769969-Alexandrium_andersonii.AAC.1